MGFLFSNITLRKVVKMLNKAVASLFCVSIYVQKILSTYGMISEQTRNYFFAFFCSFLVSSPEKAAQATSTDPKQALLGNVGSALCTSRVLCAALTDTPTRPRRDLVLFLTSHTLHISLTLSRSVSSFQLSHFLCIIQFVFTHEREGTSLREIQQQPRSC